jgi:DNA-binding response OmpR family regulator
MMPVLDGYGVFQIISKNLELQHIPFIFLSAKSERNDLRKGMEMGADDYITKPFSDSELINAIRARLEKIKLFIFFQIDFLIKINPNETLLFLKKNISLITFFI